MKTFPIQADYRHGKEAGEIPWWLAEEAYREYEHRYHNGQTLERLAERGGFSSGELLDLLRNTGDNKKEAKELRDKLRIYEERERFENDMRTANTVRHDKS